MKNSTMTQEQKNLLLKDLCARLPYGVMLKTDNVFPQKLEGISFDKDTFVVWVSDGGFTLDYMDCKPYLFPLSSMTEEQEKELSKLGVSYGEYALHDDTRGLGIMVDEAYVFFEFCYKHHIDFLGLIEIGLANDATGLNIY